MLPLFCVVAATYLAAAAADVGAVIFVGAVADGFGLEESISLLCSLFRPE
jgi:hypothetical protein